MPPRKPGSRIRSRSVYQPAAALGPDTSQIHPNHKSRHVGVCVPWEFSYPPLASLALVPYVPLVPVWCTCALNTTRVCDLYHLCHSEPPLPLSPAFFQLHRQLPRG
eukprot:scaffold1220_cov117-Isochrysis_galbana.AAC.12